MIKLIFRTSKRIIQNKFEQNNFGENMGQTRPLFLVISFFSNTNFTEKLYLDVSGIRTRIIVIEGKYADHLTTTTAREQKILVRSKWNEEKENQFRTGFEVPRIRLGK